MKLNQAVATVYRKLAIAIIHRRLRGSYSEALFPCDLYQLARAMECLTGVQSHITLAAWIRYYYRRLVA